MVDVSLKYTAADDSWYAGVYVRNAGDEDHLYAKYSTDPTVAGFANGVAIDPKIAGFNFGTITKSYNDMFAWLLDNQDIEFGLIDQPGLQEDSTVSIRLVDLGTISNPL